MLYRIQIEYWLYTCKAIIKISRIILLVPLCTHLVDIYLTLTMLISRPGKQQNGSFLHNIYNLMKKIDTKQVIMKRIYDMHNSWLGVHLAIQFRSFFQMKSWVGWCLKNWEKLHKQRVWRCSWPPGPLLKSLRGESVCSI